MASKEERKDRRDAKGEDQPGRRRYVTFGGDDDGGTEERIIFEIQKGGEV